MCWYLNPGLSLDQFQQIWQPLSYIAINCETAFHYLQDYIDINPHIIAWVNILQRKYEYDVT